MNRDHRPEAAPRRVAIVRQNLFVPSETFIRSQATALTRYTPVFIARRSLHNVPPETTARSLDAQLHRVEDLRYAVTARSARLRDLVAGSKAQLVHAHFGPDGLYAADAAKYVGVPLIVTLHGRDVTVRRRELISSGRPVAMRYAFGRRSLGRSAAALLCVSDEIRRSAIEAGLDERKLVTHYIGVDTETYAEHLGPREPEILHVARLVEKKGTEYLIDAFSSISSSYRDHRLVIVGEGPLYGQLKARANASPAAARIEFRGHLQPEEVRKLVSRAQIFALPSVRASNGDREGLPIALLEAMSLGAAVVASRHSGIPEAINDPSVGSLVEERDVSSLARALVEIISDPDGAREIGAAAARRVRKSFNIRTQSALLEDIYDSVL